MGVRTSEMAIVVRAKDMASRAFQRVKGSVSRFASYTRKKFDAIKGAVFSLKGALLGLGAAAVVRSFVRTAAGIENMRTTLAATLGDVREANTLFDDLAKFAGKVPFQLEEIMRTATAFSGTFKGGREEIMKFMPLVADLAGIAKAQGISFEEAGEQIQRMFSAGAASADRFREKGILAMLGFQAGVSYSAEETKEQVIAAWEDTNSKFAGAADELAKTWDGKVSMMTDKWFQFKKGIMEAGVMDLLKAGVEEATVAMKDLGRAAPDAGKKIVDAMKDAVWWAAAAADGLRLLRIVGKGVKILWHGLRGVIQLGIGNMIYQLNALYLLVRKAPFSDRIPGIDAFGKALASAADNVKGGIDAGNESIRKLLKEISDLRNQPTNVEVVEQKFKDLAASIERARKEAAKLAKTTAQSERLKAMLDDAETIKGLSDAEGIVGIDLSTAALEERWRKMAGSVAGAKDEVKGMKDETEDLSDATERTSEHAMMLKSAFSEAANIVHNTFIRALDEAYDKGVQWRALFQDMLKDLSKAALGMAFQFGMNAATTAIFARGGVVSGGIERLPRAAKGMVVQGPTPLIAGDNPSRREGLVPLKRMASGNLGVETSGGSGANVTINIPAISGPDARQVLARHIPMIEAMLHRSLSERGLSFA